MDPFVKCSPCGSGNVTVSVSTYKDTFRIAKKVGFTGPDGPQIAESSAWYTREEAEHVLRSLAQELGWFVTPQGLSMLDAHRALDSDPK